MSIDRRYQRIAKRLEVFDLVRDDEADDDLGLIASGASARASRRFLDFYGRDGIERALREYGIHRTLEEQGLGEYDVCISRDDLGRHRMQLLLDGVVDDDHRLVDLIIRPVTIRAATVTEGRVMAGTFDVLHVEWLCLQNPRAEFASRRPRLPGQRFPGLGIGDAVHNVTCLMAQRLGRDGVLNVPEHFHLAAIYERVGYAFVSRYHEREVAAATAGTRRLQLAVAAWAAERGLLRLADDRGQPSSEPWIYQPAEMIAPVSKRLRDGLRSLARRLSLGLSQREPRVTVDLDELRRSLADDPVEGIDPNHLMRA